MSLWMRRSSVEKTGPRRERPLHRQRLDAVLPAGQPDTAQRQRQHRSHEHNRHRRHGIHHRSTTLCLSSARHGTPRERRMLTAVGALSHPRRTPGPDGRSSRPAGGRAASAGSRIRPLSRRRAGRGGRRTSPAAGRSQASLSEPSRSTVAPAPSAIFSIAVFLGQGVDQQRLHAAVAGVQGGVGEQARAQAPPPRRRQHGDAEFSRCTMGDPRCVVVAP